MRIESKVGVAVVADSREGKPAATGTTTDSSSPTSSPASIVKLSAAGTTAQSLSDAEVSPANASRIASIRSAIQRGQYPIDLDKLASRIVDDDVVRGRS